ncbi:MAG: DNA repair protein RadA [Peptoniphilaceae bacterium]|nr:DNA repair protein RadA [Peptoniphilaceae bacterium]MDY3738609.1 DNA repair protein RadA [Peptoniphilaceae bacterium]
MAKIKKVFECKKCGHTQNVWAGQCPECKSWGSLIEKVVTKERISHEDFSDDIKSVKLNEIVLNKNDRIKSTYEEFDRVVGGGLVCDSVSILTARPGAGKSTLLLQLSKSYAQEGKKVLYISGEESESQIKSRAKRIIEDIPENIWILSTNSMNKAISEVKRTNADIIFIDSIQTMQLKEFDSKAASPTQTIECTQACVELAKDINKKRSFIIVGHMTKSGEMAGLRTLEHLVDTVLFLEGEPEEDLRMLTSSKNRFGRTGEIGLFSMQEEGLIEIKNPGEYFITQREKPVEGSSLCVIKEGSRILEVEIESLVSKSFQNYPQRIGDSLRKDELNTLISILQERCGLNLYDKDVIIKTTGGIKISNSDADLSIMMSIASSLLKKTLSSKICFIAEVGLTGELKKVRQINNRLSEIERLGYKRCYVAKKSTDEKYKTLEVLQMESIKDVLKNENFI